jgi:hypothetical protein
VEHLIGDRQGQLDALRGRRLGGHLKTGHSWPPENRPLATKRDGGFYSFACG